MYEASVCPKCNAPIIPSDEKFIYCKHCGNYLVNTVDSKGQNTINTIEEILSQINRSMSGVEKTIDDTAKATNKRLDQRADEITDTVERSVKKSQYQSQASFKILLAKYHELNELEFQLKEVEKEIQKVEKIIRNGQSTQTYRSRLRELSIERRQLERDIVLLKTELEINVPPKPQRRPADTSYDTGFSVGCMTMVVIAVVIYLYGSSIGLTWDFETLFAATLLTIIPSTIIGFFAAGSSNSNPDDNNQTRKRKD